VTVAVLDNYDKMTIKNLLLNKMMKVGEVVLVNGKPALIKRRRISSTNELPSYTSILKDEKRPFITMKSKRIRSRNLGESNSDESRQILLRRSKVAPTSLTPMKKRVLRRKLLTRY